MFEGTREIFNKHHKELYGEELYDGGSLFEGTREIFNKHHKELYGEELYDGGSLFEDIKETFDKKYKDIYGEDLYNSGDSIPNKIKKIKEEAKDVKSKLDSGEIKKKEAQKRISKLADKTTKLVKNDIQDSLKRSVDGLKGYIDQNV